MYLEPPEERDTLSTEEITYYTLEMNAIKDGKKRSLWRGNWLKAWGEQQASDNTGSDERIRFGAAEKVKWWESQKKHLKHQNNFWANFSKYENHLWSWAGGPDGLIRRRRKKNKNSKQADSENASRVTLVK